MEGADLRILFTYRLLVQAGYLDDDIGAEEPVGNRRAPRRIAVYDDLCIGCYACREVCPGSAIRVWDGEAHITNPLKCVDCADAPCVPICPTGALEDGGLGASCFP